ncbi:TPA: hypothetical protein ACH3X1_001537 [Trebouxia sp. C0004]
MSKTLGPVALKLGDEVLVKLRTNTTVQDLLEQLDKACKGGRIQDADGFDVTAHFSQDLPEGEYAIKQPTADTDAATDGGTKEGKPPLGFGYASCLFHHPLNRTRLTACILGMGANFQ